MDIDLKGRVAIISGGNKGIGKAIVFKLIEEKVNVCILNRNKEQAELIQKKISEQGGQSIICPGDSSDEEHCKFVVKQTIEAFGKVDFLINNAGITKDNLLMRMKSEEWEDVININLKSMFLLSREVSRHMMKARFGRIINIGSIVGSTGNPGQSNYSTSKAGIIGFTKSLAKELASRNILCNTIAPGFINTDMTNVLDDKLKENILKNIPLGRIADPDEIAHAVLFLCSHLSNYITGTTLHVNGGMY